MRKNKFHTSLILKLLFPFLIGILFSIFVKLAFFGYEQAQGSCNTGIAPCFIGIEYLLLIPIIWIASFIALWIIFGKIGYQRKRLVMFLGTIFFFIQLWWFNEGVNVNFETYHLEEFSVIQFPFLYLVNYGLLSTIYPSMPVLKSRATSFLLRTAVWLIMFLSLPFLFRVILIQIDLYRINSVAKNVESLPSIDDPNSFFQNISLGEREMTEKDVLYKSPFYPYTLLSLVNIELINLTSNCRTEKLFITDKRWRVFWIKMQNYGSGCEQSNKETIAGPYRLTSDFDIEEYEDNSIKKLR